jgi:membrane protease YdiL (CAAX protease family)
MSINEIFINEYGRLRSGWRLTIFLLALSLCLGVLGAIIGVILHYLPIGFSPESLLGFAASNGILLFAAILVGWLCGKFFENLPFRALGAWFARHWLKDLSLGLVFGAISVCFAALITVIFGATSFQLNRDAGQSAILLTLAVSLGVFTIGAAAEEALFRGYILQTFVRANLAWLAIALTSLFFASAHLRNPNANYIAMLNTVLAGVWFSVAYLKTRTLWLAFGLHLAWNWTQGAILGSPVSGITEITTAPFLLPTNTGSTVLTGGDYGIEGGIACTIALVFSVMLLWFLPFFKPSEEMLALTSKETPKRQLA